MAAKTTWKFESTGLSSGTQSADNFRRPPKPNKKRAPIDIDDKNATAKAILRSYFRKAQSAEK